jgi:hypothetical protein
MIFRVAAVIDYVDVHVRVIRGYWLARLAADELS